MLQDMAVTIAVALVPAVILVLFGIDRYLVKKHAHR